MGALLAQLSNSLDNNTLVNMQSAGVQLLDGQPVGHHNRNLPQPAAAGGRRAAALQAIVARRRQMINSGGGGGAADNDNVLPPLFAAGGRSDGAEGHGGRAVSVEALEPDVQFAAQVMLQQSWRQAGSPYQPFFPGDQGADEAASGTLQVVTTQQEDISMTAGASAASASRAADPVEAARHDTGPRRQPSTRADRLERISRSSSFGTASRQLEPPPPPRRGGPGPSADKAGKQSGKPRSSSLLVQPPATRRRPPGTADLLEAGYGALGAQTGRSEQRPIPGLRLLQRGRVVGNSAGDGSTAGALAGAAMRSQQAGGDDPVDDISPQHPTTPAQAPHRQVWHTSR